jgi:hypothetical protein
MGLIRLIYCWLAIDQGAILAATDKDAWVANWRKVLKGEIRMLDPVGTPEKVGFEEAWLLNTEAFNCGF